MSRLPRAGSARIDDAKIRDYLLRPDHPIGAPKAAFFASFRFSQTNWLDLKRALLDHPHANPVARRTTSPYGEKYAVSCSLRTPDGRNPCVRSVWLVERFDPDPRLVTAHPGP